MPYNCCLGEFTVAQKTEPNLYDLKGVGVTVSYSTSSISGEPRLSFKKGRLELNFAGDEITTVETSIGTVVTVTIGTTVDRGFTTFSMLLPSISLADSAVKQAVRTLGITTEHTTSIAGPVKGAQQTYKALRLRGSAKLAQFLSNTAGTSA
jgi:hypothetical protein